MDEFEKFHAEQLHIVMVTHGDRLEHLRRTVPALMATDFYPYTITIVANDPAASSLVYLRGLSNGGWFDLIVNTENLGFAIAANQAWRARPEARYCVHLGDDMLALESDWLKKLVTIIDFCPEVGIVGHSVEPAAWPVRTLGSPPCTVQVQPSGIGGCLLIPQRTWEVCGYYNEEMGPYGEEDALYGWKVRQAGLLCAYYDWQAGERSFAHLGNDEPEYWSWKDARRVEAIEVRNRLMAEYATGTRPLNE
jgi:GT2 family glycosyltransferase